MKKILLIILIFSMQFCSLFNENTKAEELNFAIKFLQSFDIDMPEPSGLALSWNGDFLYSVSDSTGNIYQIDFEGNVIREINLYAKFDLEGICCSADRNFWVVEEKYREIMKVSQTGQILARKSIFHGYDNNGLEGICYGKDSVLTALKEKDSALLIEVNKELDVQSYHKLEFASDYSAITYDKKLNIYLLLSQEDRKLFFYDVEKEEYKAIDLPMVNAEGIAYDSSTNILYIVDDASSKLYQYKLEIIK